MPPGQVSRKRWWRRAVGLGPATPHNLLSQRSGRVFFADPLPGLRAVRGSVPQRVPGRRPAPASPQRQDGTLLKLILSGVKSRRRRFTLGALAIVLGVGFVSGTLVLSQSVRHSFHRLLGQVTFGVDVYVRGPETDRKQGISDFAAIPDQLLGQMRSVSGVAAAQGQVV